MGCFGINRDRTITARVAKQMRTGIALGELSYNFKVKGDLASARRVMLQASRSSKHTYLSALHALATKLGCVSDRSMLL